MQQTEQWKSRSKAGEHQHQKRDRYRRKLQLGNASAHHYTSQSLSGADAHSLCNTDFGDLIFVGGGQRSRPQFSSPPRRPSTASAAATHTTGAASTAAAKRAPATTSPHPSTAPISSAAAQLTNPFAAAALASPHIVTPSTPGSRVKRSPPPSELPSSAYSPHLQPAPQDPFTAVPHPALQQQPQYIMKRSQGIIIFVGRWIPTGGSRNRGSLR